MSIDFPNSPTLNQTFSTAGKNWQWDGTAWQLLAVAPDAILKSVLDAKGDLVVGTAADTVGRLGVGTDGQVLAASSSASGGIVWSTPSSYEDRLDSIEDKLDSIEAIAILGL